MTTAAQARRCRTARWLDGSVRRDDRPTLAELTLGGYRVLLGDRDPVDVVEIARRLGVKAVTVRAWRARPATNFPPPRWAAAGGLWDWTEDILPWAKATGRWKTKE